MYRIFENQILEVENMISFKGKLETSELVKVGKEMEEIIRSKGATTIGYPISATFGADGKLIDVEAILPINKKIDVEPPYIYKNKLKIVNAIKLEYKGNPYAK